MNEVVNWLISGDASPTTILIVVGLYVAANVYVKVSSAPTKEEGWQRVAKELAQQISATDFKGGKMLTWPGAKGKPDE